MRAESSPVGYLKDQDSSGDKESWGLMKPLISLKLHRQ